MYTWRSQSSQFLRRRQLIWGSILFHVGILLLFFGHFFGLLTPPEVYTALGITVKGKQLLAVIAGGIFALICFIGMTMLIHRRLFDPRIRLTSKKTDIFILLFIYLQLIIGMAGIPYSLADPEALAAARVKAQEAIDLLKERPDRFADLARDLSACPSAKQGGNLGQLTRGSTVPEVETFVFQLEEGQLCPVPVRSRYGYHVLRVERRVCGRPLPFEAVHEKIAAFLDDRVWRQAVRQYIELLIGSADIKGIDLKGSISPLVQ